LVYVIRIDAPAEEREHIRQEMERIMKLPDGDEKEKAICKNIGELHRKYRSQINEKRKQIGIQAPPKRSQLTRKIFSPDWIQPKPMEKAVSKNAES
jgi:hypothetical protein